MGLSTSISAGSWIWPKWSAPAASPSPRPRDPR
jgi:hypothetical protein